MSRVIQFITIGFGAALIIVAIFTVAIYGFGIDNHATRAFNRTLPILPAAMVSGKLVFLSEVDRRLEMYENGVNFQSKDAEIDRELVRGQILGQLIEQEIIDTLTESPLLGFSGPSVDEYASYILTRFEMRPEPALGVSEREFFENIIFPDFQSKILAASIQNEARGSLEFERAENVKKMLDDGMEFSEAARLYSEDEDSKYLGGDQGLLTFDEINPWLKEAAFGLSASTTSEIIVSPEGYHILRVPSRDPGPPEKIELQHIFIRGVDFDEYLEKQKKNYRIYLFSRD